MKCGLLLNNFTEYLYLKISNITLDPRTIAEKAYAQFSELNSSETHSTNSYQTIISGSGLNALAAISGIATNWSSPQAFAGVASIASLLSSRNTLTADTPSTNNSGNVVGTSANNPTPIYGSHEYMIIGANITAKKVI